MANEISIGDKDDFSLPWTGERFVPSLRGPIYYEHLHRYAMALELIADRNCLDIACGEGFGSSLLARKAKFVWGVDLDAACINHACKKYVKSNLKFLAGSATKIPLEDNSVDVVVSFETIEHFGEHDAFMQEIRRVLTSDGFLIISSPDKNEYSGKTGHKNPYHIIELYHSEFDQLLRRYFSQVKLGHQRLAVGSYILNDKKDNKDTATCGVFSGNLLGTNYEEGLPDGVYSIAICSNQPLPQIKYGLFEDLTFLRGEDALQTRINAENEAIRQHQQSTEHKAAAEKAQNQIHLLLLEKDDARQEYERAKISWDQQLAEQKEAAEKAQNQISHLLLEKDDARQEYERAKVSWDQQLTEHKEAAEKAQNHIRQEYERAKVSWDQQLTELKEATEKAQSQIHHLLLEKDDALQEREQAKASWDQQLTEQKASIERSQKQIDHLIAENHRLEEIVDSAVKWQQRPWLKRVFHRWRVVKTQKKETETQAGHEKSLIVASGLFDAEFYARMYPDVATSGMDLLDHYVNHGRQEGRVPSEKFDPQAYFEANPDLDRHAIDPILHYILHGQPEGRSLVSKAEREAEDILRQYKARKPAQALLQLPHILRFLLPKQEREAEDILRHYKARKPTVLVVSHEGSRTGAPILVYNLTLHLLKQYDVIVLFLGPGPLLEACAHIGAVVLGPVNGAKADRFAATLLRYVQPRFAIVNSVESWQMGIALSRVGVPTVSLIHEFAAYTRPRGVLYDVAWHSDATIFSTTLTRDNALEYHPELGRMDLPVIPQGPCALPETTNGQHRDRTLFSDELNQRAIRPSSFPVDGLVVLGMGTVQLRKGVDLFLDCAARIKRMEPKIPIRFVWVGKGFNPEVDDLYSVYLADQILRAGLEDMVEIIDEMASLDQVYAASNIFLLTSRLDPLPNVAIDVLTKSIPIICFDQTTGIADYLKAHDLGGHCVARYLDTADMTEKLLALVRSEKLRADLGERSSKLAADLFSMPRYIEKIVSIGERIGERQSLWRQESEQEAEFIASANILRSDFVLRPNSKNSSPLDLARHYITSWKRNICLRKPFPGFHPGIYREARGLGKGGIDPLADYLRSDQPEGPWRLPVITPDTPNPAKIIPRVALHLHAYYPDLVLMILDRLHRNETPFDLLVSVTSDQHRNQVLGLLESYSKGAIDVRVVPNVGRDLGALLSCFSETIRENYDLVGHIHTKKSVHLDSRMGEEWLQFLMENLLGGKAPMADIILNAMAQDERIGLVFPDDPHILSWGKNRPYGDDMARRLKLPALPEEINFPVGTMFWARVSALEALFDLKLSWNDYPQEPLPADGSMLHAIERLLPSIVLASGRSLAVTNVPGVTR